MIFFPSVIGIAMLVLVLLRVTLRRQPIPQRYRSMATAWMLVGVCSVFLMLDVSEALWLALWSIVPKVIFPWRMQLAASLAILIIFCILSSDNTSKKKQQGDFFILILCMFALSQIQGVHNGVHDMFLKTDENINRFVASFASLDNFEYRTEWEQGYECRRVDFSNIQKDYALFKRCTEGDRIENIPEGVTAKVLEWGNERIALEVSAKKPARIKLRQVYFPTWQVRGGEIAPTSPDGHMLLSVPAGKGREVLLTQNPAQISPWVSVAYAASALAALGLFRCCA